MVLDYLSIAKVVCVNSILVCLPLMFSNLSWISFKHFFSIFPIFEIAGFFLTVLGYLKQQENMSDKVLGGFMSDLNFHNYLINHDRYWVSIELVKRSNWMNWMEAAVQICPTGIHFSNLMWKLFNSWKMSIAGGDKDELK